MRLRIGMDNTQPFYGHTICNRSASFEHLPECYEYAACLGRIPHESTADSSAEHEFGTLAWRHWPKDKYFANHSTLLNGTANTDRALTPECKEPSEVGIG